MLELIHAATGGGVGLTLLWALIKRPQAFAAILALLVAPFPGERIYGRYREMSGLPVPEKSSAKKKKARRGVK